MSDALTETRAQDARPAAPRTRPVDDRRMIRVFAPEIRPDEDIDAYGRRNFSIAAPLGVVTILYESLHKFMMAMNAKNVERNSRIAALETRLAQAEARLASVENRPGLSYEGVWSAERSYGAGMAVTSSGSVWIGKKASAGCRPGTDADTWQLAVKRGNDGRDAGR